MQVMVESLLRAFLMAALSLAVVEAAAVEGAVVIKRKLTKRKVTASAAAYERGVRVEVGADPQQDPLAFERTRVVIYLEGQLPSKPVTATMEQKNRRFLPDTLVVPAGSTVSFPNLDPIFHNVFSLSNLAAFDLGNYAKDHTRTVTFPKPGIIFVGCHLHTNMGAVIVVSPNQWCTKPDADGRFTLPDAPSGTYTIVAWHKAAGFFRQTVRIDNGRVAKLQFLIPLDEIRLARTVAQR